MREETYYALQPGDTVFLVNQITNEGTRVELVEEHFFKPGQPFKSLTDFPYTCFLPTANRFLANKKIHAVDILNDPTNKRGKRRMITSDYPICLMLNDAAAFNYCEDRQKGESKQRNVINELKKLQDKVDKIYEEGVEDIKNRHEARLIYPTIDIDDFLEYAKYAIDAEDSEEGEVLPFEVWSNPNRELPIPRDKDEEAINSDRKISTKTSRRRRWDKRPKR